MTGRRRTVNTQRVAAYATAVSIFLGVVLVAPMRDVDGWLSVVRDAAPADDATQKAIVMAFLEDALPKKPLIDDRIGVRHVVVLDTYADCTTPDGCADLAGEVAALETESVDSDLGEALADANRHSRAMHLDPIPGLGLIRRTELPRRESFALAGDDTVYTTSLSWAAVSADRKQAVIAVGTGCNSLLCGSGSIVLLVKDRNGWRVHESQMTWIS